MTLLLVLILAVYCLLLMAFLFGWSESRFQVAPLEGATMSCISVIVPFRNEAQNLPVLIKSLSKLVYVIHNYEVILVDDHSTDGSRAVAERLARDGRNIRLICLPEGVAGKKQALLAGIQASAFDIIATTDSDCQFHEQWLWQVSTYFERAETQLLVGPVKLDAGKSILSRLQAMEFTSLAASTAAAIGIGHPILCNGANLAFRKRAFFEVGGYEGNMNIPSGDDEFLLHKMMKHYRRGVVYLNAPEGVVTSNPVGSLKEFIGQRVRWAGKWKHNGDPLAKWLAVFIAAAHFSFFTLLILFVMNPGMTFTFLLIKVILEGVLLAGMSRFYGVPFDALAFGFWQFLYTPYVLVIGLLAQRNNFRWKDRNFK
ncbi:MAG TPA: glycosyltransferase [Cyclobacteriaceae bacterium]|nr:glycosyltransferase [Cyclobacteriaceae bacterium]